VAQASLVCFELTAMNVLVSYWTPDLHPTILISVGIVSYAGFQLWSVRIFGEVEFWLSITKVLLMIGLTLYTFVSMVGGNPLKDKFGFRYWAKPGPFVGDTAAPRMKGVFDALVWACFAWVWPDDARSPSASVDPIGSRLSQGRSSRRGKSCQRRLTRPSIGSCSFMSLGRCASA
jgi:amino acid transporter